MSRGNIKGSKRGPYLKRIKAPVEEMSLSEWLHFIQCSSNLPRTAEDLLRHKAVIERFLKEL